MELASFNGGCVKGLTIFFFGIALFLLSSVGYAIDSKAGSWDFEVGPVVGTNFFNLNAPAWSDYTQTFSTIVKDWGWTNITQSVSQSPDNLEGGIKFEAVKEIGRAHV